MDVSHATSLLSSQYVTTQSFFNPLIEHVKLLLLSINHGKKGRTFSYSAGCLQSEYVRQPFLGSDIIVF